MIVMAKSFAFPSRIFSELNLIHETNFQKMKLFAIFAVLVSFCIVFVGTEELMCCPCDPETIFDGSLGPACKQCACANKN